MTNAIVTILAKFLQALKTKNAVIFTLIQAALVGVYSIVQEGIAVDLIPDASVWHAIIEYGSVLLMALIGTKTVRDLPDDFDPGSLKEVLANILDAFKVKNPKMFMVIQVALIGAFSVLTFGGFELSGDLDTVLKVVTMLAIIVTGSRTGRYVDN